MFIKIKKCQFKCLREKCLLMLYHEKNIPNSMYRTKEKRDKNKFWKLFLLVVNNYEMNIIQFKDRVQVKLSNYSYLV